MAYFEVIEASWNTDPVTCIHISRQLNISYIIWAPSNEFVSSSIQSWQSLMRVPSHSEGPGIWLSVWRFLLTHCLYERAAKALARLRGCAGSPEPSLLAQAISYKFAWCSPYNAAWVHIWNFTVSHWWCIIMHALPYRWQVKVIRCKSSIRLRASIATTWLAKLSAINCYLQTWSVIVEKPMSRQNWPQFAGMAKLQQAQSECSRYAPNAAGMAPISRHAVVLGHFVSLFPAAAVEQVRRVFGDNYNN